jgi:outer membrane protein OmpA-like peptidoglycan-associated protein
LIARTRGRSHWMVWLWLSLAGCAAHTPMKRTGPETSAVPAAVAVPGPEAAQQVGKLEALLRSKLPAGIELKRQDQNIWLRATAADAFVPDASTSSAAGSALLDVVAEGLIQSSQQGLQIRVFTDGLGSRVANEQFAAARAESVRTYLHSRGIALRRMQVLAGGPDSAPGTNETPEGRQLKRRLELLITPLFS